jgi:hypothetical protein
MGCQTPAPTPAGGAGGGVAAMDHPESYAKKHDPADSGHGKVADGLNPRTHLVEFVMVCFPCNYAKNVQTGQCERKRKAGQRGSHPRILAADPGLHTLPALAAILPAIPLA